MSKSRGANPVRSPTPEMRIISGRAIGITGPGIQQTDGVKTPGWTIARTGTGVYVVTLDLLPTHFMGSQATVMSATNKFDANVQAYSLTAGTVTYTTYITNTGTATDLGTAEELWFTLTVGWSQRS